MRVVSGPVLLLWVLALQRGARACHGPGVQISGVSEDRRSHVDYYTILGALYGDSVDIFCSGTDSTNLNISLGNTYPEGVTPGRQLEKVANETTVQLTVEKPVVGTYDYYCTDVKTGCVSSLHVMVRPMIIIKSSHMHQKQIKDFVLYYVPVDEDYEVVCIGNSDLRITATTDDVSHKRIQSICVNETTITSFKLREKKYLDILYRCQHSDSLTYLVDVSNARAYVSIDYKPAAVNFWCVQDDFQIDCFWSMLSQDTTFSLFYKGQNGNMMHLCEKRLTPEKTKHCGWSITEMSDLHLTDNFSLVIQACNPTYCENETYFMNHNSITKTISPDNLKVLEKSSHGATVSWSEYETFYPIMRYKVMYQLPGKSTKQLNPSSFLVTCEKHKFYFLKDCKVELRLPCPGTFYVVEVYKRLASTPHTNDAYWSEPATITFWTKPQTSTDAVDPSCDEEPELIDNKYVGVSEVRKLARSSHQDGVALRGLVNSMEHKLDKIKAFCHESGRDDCENCV